MKLSVVICAHNPHEPALARTVAALQAQTLPTTDWELLLIDNASERPLAQNWDLSWHPNARHVRETQLGLTHARLRGVEEARSEVLVFVDDDNVLAADYLEAALACARDAPWLGAWGGQVDPEVVDGEVPPWAEEVWLYLAVRPVFEVKWCNFPGGNCSPVGAGLCVRRHVALAYAHACRTDPRRLNLDRQGDVLASHGDTDMAYTATKVGLGFGVFPQLRLTHLIPAARLSEPYLLKLLHDSHFSYGIIRAIYQFSLPPEPGLLGRVRSWIWMRRRLNPRQRRFERAITRGSEAGIRLAREVLKERRS